jgi:hypothetical protein
MTTSDAVQFTGQIAALQGAPGETIQTILMGWTPPDGIDVPKWRC